MKLFYSPGACSIGIHVLLEEIGAPYEPVLTNLRQGKHMTPEYKAINPKSRVPALVRPDGSVLTEFQTIAFWLARNHPQANLLPADADAQVRVQEVLDYIVATVHMRGFTLFRVPQKFAPSEAAQAEVKAHGAKAFQEGIAVLADILGDKSYLVGDFSIADAAGFYITNWANENGFALPGKLGAYLDRLKARPAIQRVLKREAEAAASLAA